MPILGQGFSNANVLGQGFSDANIILGQGSSNANILGQGFSNANVRSGHAFMQNSSTRCLYWLACLPPERQDKTATYSFALVLEFSCVRCPGSLTAQDGRQGIRREYSVPSLNQPRGILDQGKEFSTNSSSSSSFALALAIADETNDRMAIRMPSKKV